MMKLKKLCLWAAAATLAAGSSAACAKPKFAHIVVDDVAGTENCGIDKGVIAQTIAKAAEGADMRVRPDGGDFIVFADVNVIGIPNDIGLWSGSCAFNINIEVQRHQDIQIRGVGKALASAKLCDAGFIGYMSTGRRSYLTGALTNSFEACIAQLPLNVRRALSR